MLRLLVILDIGHAERKSDGARESQRKIRDEMYVSWIVRRVCCVVRDFLPLFTFHAHTSSMHFVVPFFPYSSCGCHHKQPCSHVTREYIFTLHSSYVSTQLSILNFAFIWLVIEYPYLSFSHAHENAFGLQIRRFFYKYNNLKSHMYLSNIMYKDMVIINRR